MQERVCERWGTQTTAIEIAKQNSEMTGFPPPRGGEIARGEGISRVGYVHSMLPSRTWTLSLDEIKLHELCFIG